MKVVALNALTGETVYFDKSDMTQDDYHILKASSSLPVVCRPYFVDGIPYKTDNFCLSASREMRLYWHCRQIRRYNTQNGYPYQDSNQKHRRRKFPGVRRLHQQLPSSKEPPSMFNGKKYKEPISMNTPKACLPLFGYICLN